MCVSPHSDNSTGHSPASFKYALEMLSGEAQYWRRAIADLERQVDASSLDAGVAGSLQTLDLARQGLQGLALVLADLARQVDPGFRCNFAGALTALPMQSQAQRLFGHPTADAVGCQPPELWDVP